jgi:hypothetical protein
MHWWVAVGPCHHCLACSRRRLRKSEMQSVPPNQQKKAASSCLRGNNAQSSPLRPTNRRSAHDACCTKPRRRLACSNTRNQDRCLSLAHLGHYCTGRHAKSSSATRGTLRPTVSQQLGPNEIEDCKENEKAATNGSVPTCCSRKYHDQTPSPNSARAFRIPLVELWDMGATQIQMIPSYWEYASNSPKARPALPRFSNCFGCGPVRAFDVRIRGPELCICVVCLPLPRPSRMLYHVHVGTCAYILCNTGMQLFASTDTPCMRRSQVLNAHLFDPQMLRLSDRRLAQFIAAVSRVQRLT